MFFSLLRIIDRYIFGLFIPVVRLFKSYSQKEKEQIIAHPKKILVIRLWALGSTLLTFPSITRLLQCYPDAEFSVVATNRSLFLLKNQNYFSHYYNLFALKDLCKLIFSFRKYDIVVDTEDYFHISALVACWVGKISSGYSNLPLRKFAFDYGYIVSDNNHNVLNNLALLQPFGISQEPPKSLVPVKYTSENKDKALSFFDNTFPLSLVLHTAGAETSPERFWSSNNWVSLIEEVVSKSKNIAIYLTGTEFERQSVEKILNSLSENAKTRVIDISGRMNLCVLSAFLEHADLVVSNDTGPMHLSAAMGTKTIGLFGPNTPDAFGPWPADKNITFYHGDGDACIKVHKGLFRKDKNQFIDKITPEEVVTTILKTLDSGKKEF